MYGIPAVVGNRNAAYTRTSTGQKAKGVVTTSLRESAHTRVPVRLYNACTRYALANNTGAFRSGNGRYSALTAALLIAIPILCRAISQAPWPAAGTIIILKRHYIEGTTTAVRTRTA